MAYDPLNDPEFDAIKARIESAGDEDATEQLAADIGARRDAAEHPIRRFALNAPKNIGIGAWKALVNTVDTLSDAAGEVAKGAAEKVTGLEIPQQYTPSLSEQFPEVMNSLRNFTTEWERNDNLGDDITQGVAQFAIPFMGWMKVAGGLGKVGTAAKVGKALAVEAGTAASAFDPQEGRVADLLEMGRESETRFGMLLRQIAPDESLVNQYIEYMTNREDEGVWEGRWKNAVDAVVSSAALGALLKAAPATYKFGKFALEDMGVSGGPGAKYQKGMVAFHGTPHDFDAFDLSKIGTGEGGQMYSHGLYFAENPAVAKEYRRVLSSSYLEHNGQKVFAEEWDGLPVKGAVKDLMLEAKRVGLSNDGIKMFTEREIKRNPGKWGLRNREQQLEALKLARETKALSGTVMTVDIPDEVVSRMMDWDKPLAQQPAVVEKLKASPVWKQLRDDFTFFSQGEGTDAQMLETMTGADVYDVLSGKSMDFDPSSINSIMAQGDRAAEASKTLNALGIPGMRYLDKGSRAKNEGTRNLVLYDDKLVKITKKE